jgi:hypothetical protein
MRYVRLMTVAVMVCGGGCLLDDGGDVGVTNPQTPPAPDAGAGTMTPGHGSGTGRASSGSGTGMTMGSGTGTGTDAATETDTGTDVAVAADASDAAPPTAVTCPGTQGTVLATEAPGGIITLALDSTNLFWTFGPDVGADLSDGGTWPATGQVRSVPKVGGGASTISSTEDFPAGIVVAGQNVYWGTWRGPSREPTPVRWAPVAGGAPADFSSPTNAAFGFGEYGLAADDTALYWFGGADQLLSEPLAGGGAADLSGPPGVVAFSEALDATNVYWMGTDLQVADVCDSSGCGAALGVFAAPKAGGTAHVIATYGLNVEPAVFTGIAADASGVYWTDPYGSIMTVPSVGATPITLVAGSGTGGWSGGPLAIDATSVYWADESATLRSVPKGGGATTTIATGETEPQSLAVDESFVYWANGCGQIKKTAK